MSFLINSPGPTTILSSTASGAGQWHRVHPKMRTLTFQVTHTGSSLGATVQSTCIIQASNDGVNPLQTTGGSTVDALGTVVLNGGSPQAAGFTINAGWPYVRANLLSAPSTGTVAVTVGGSWEA